jgi:hypothetical protein
MPPQLYAVQYPARELFAQARECEVLVSLCMISRMEGPIEVDMIGLVMN